MNNFCADDARVACPLFQAEYGGSRPTSALQLRFASIGEDTFKKLNTAWHSRLPKIGNSHFRVCYFAECGNLIYAVAAWSNPVARLLPQATWLELRRFAIAPDAPKFTASRMLGWMRRDIAKRFPKVERLISYQDLEAHKGTIYKASGWKHAENFKPRARGWIGWGNKPRKGRTNQSVAPRMRWEIELMKLPAQRNEGELMRTIEPYTPHWEKLANDVARSYCPPIYPCQKCGHPVIHGYCCTNCHDANPSEPTTAPPTKGTALTTREG